MADINRRGFAAGLAGLTFLPQLVLADTSEVIGMPGDEVTGTMDLLRAGEAPLRLVTYARTIAARPAPENSDQTAAALLDSMAGRVIHSASWTSPDTRGATPVAFYVSIEALENPDPRTRSARVSLEFQIDPATLTPLERNRSLRFRQAGQGRDGEIVSSTVDVSLDVVVPGEHPNALSLEGSFVATMDDGTVIDGNLSIADMRGSRPVAEVLEEAQ
ncbi:MAG: hypothetical protein GX970_02015 [Phyllobacteriaceae bacterium]|nr:hypothetical protein [Phyllobacteriaceae bacterium]